MTNESTINKWENFLSPDIVRRAMNLTCVYMFGYELLLKEIIEPVKIFYALDFSFPNKNTEAYVGEVLSLAKNERDAALAWLKKSEAIDENDLKNFQLLKETRNQLAHELPEFLFGSTNLLLPERLGQLKALLLKLERWWFVNFELHVNPMWDHLNPDSIVLNEILGGRGICLQMLETVALEDDDKAYQFITEWRKLKK